MEHFQDNERIIRLREVETKVGLSRATIYRLMNRGEFPRPIQLGSRAVGWREKIVNHWIKSRDANDH